MDAGKILADALRTVGRSLPVGMEVSFFREVGSSGAGMLIIEPNGKQTEYAFLKSSPLPTFALNTLLRETKIETALRDLLATIELHTDCMDGRIDRESLDPYIEAAEALLAEDWEVDTDHPANRITFVPASVSYPTGSLGEPVEV